MGAMTDEEKRLLGRAAATLTAWIIDTCRAIKNGSLDDRAAAIAQSQQFVEEVQALTKAP